MPQSAGKNNLWLKGLERGELSVCDGAASFLQSGFWGAFKARFGWEALAFTAGWACGENQKEEKPLLVLRRVLVPGFALAYIPWGPELPEYCDSNRENRAAAAKELAYSLKKKLPKDTVFIRFDPPWRREPRQSEGGQAAEETAKTPPLMPVPFVRSGSDIQPPDTVVIDLSEPIETITSRMKPKWRYNARLALKKGVTVTRAGSEKISVFYDLLTETALRDGISVHGFAYYKSIFESNGSHRAGNPDIRLYLAEHEGDVLSGIVTLFRGQKAVYLYGASSNKKRNLMAPYALQLKAVEDAKASGCLEYDLFGIPPDEDPSHPMAGLYQFKTGFGGTIVHRYGSWDYPCKFLVYRLFRAVEKLRKKSMIKSRALKK